MKSVLILASLFLSMSLLGQKKLTTVTTQHHDLNGQIYQVDSNAYHYGTWIGSLDQYKYEFKPDYSGIYQFKNFGQEIIAYDSITSFEGVSSPNSLNWVYKQTLNGDQILSRNLDFLGTNQTQKYYFTYNAQGLLQNMISEYYSLGILNHRDSTVHNYDALGNNINTCSYVVSTGQIIYTDTSTYISGTNKISHFVRYVNPTLTSIPLVKYQETFIYYLNDKVDYIDVWNSDATGWFEWTWRLKYVYNSGKIVERRNFLVTSGILDPNMYSNLNFTYNAEGNLAFEDGYLNGQLSYKKSFLYDSEGYMIDYQEFYSTNNILYPLKKEKYFFQSTASLEALENIDVVLFPNPTLDRVTILSDEKINQVQILNQLGQVLISQMDLQIEMAHLPAGNYMIVGQSDKGSFRKAIVKQ